MKHALPGCLILVCCIASAQQSGNAVHDAEQLLKTTPPRFGDAERLLRAAVDQNPNDAQALEKLTLLLTRKVRRGSPESVFDAQRYADQLLRLREATAVELPAKLALALELQGQLAGPQPEMGPGLVRALDIRKTLVREAQPPSIAGASAPCSRIGGAVERPTLISKQEPEYSQEARLASHQGTAVVMIAVDVDGQPKDVRLVRSLGFGLDEKAVQAVLSWRFEPGRRYGQPVPVCAQIEVNFRLL